METIALRVETSAGLPASVLATLPGAFTRSVAAAIAAMMSVESEVPGLREEWFLLHISQTRWTALLDDEALELSGAHAHASMHAENVVRLSSPEPQSFSSNGLVSSIEQALMSVNRLEYRNPFEVVFDILSSTPAAVLAASPALWPAAKGVEVLFHIYQSLVSNDPVLAPLLARRVATARYKDELDRLEGEPERRRIADDRARAESDEKSLQIEILRQSLAPRPPEEMTRVAAVEAFHRTLRELYPDVPDERLRPVAVNLGDDPRIADSLFKAGRWSEVKVEGEGEGEPIIAHAER